VNKYEFCKLVVNTVDHDGLDELSQLGLLGWSIAGVIATRNPFASTVILQRECGTIERDATCQ
jgi:hypothetical protein